MVTADIALGAAGFADEVVAAALVGVGDDCVVYDWMSRSAIVSAEIALMLPPEVNEAE